MSEMANYGFDYDSTYKPKGGTVEIEGDKPFHVINSSKIMSELKHLSSIGPNFPKRKWNDIIEYGEGPGSVQVSVTPLGSMRIVTRRLIKDLIGEDTWICKHVTPLDDNDDENREITIAHNLHSTIAEISNQMIDSADPNYEDLDRLAWKLWAEAKKHHPSYIMFPVALNKQNENYYKLVFEFRGQGVLRQINTKPSRAEQFDIDLHWDRHKGLIRCWGYNIDSTLSQHSWKVQPSVFDEWFSPHQKQEEIIENIINIFMQY